MASCQRQFPVDLDGFDGLLGETRCRRWRTVRSSNSVRAKKISSESCFATIDSSRGSVQILIGKREHGRP